MTTSPLPDALYLKAVRIGIPFPRRSKGYPVYADLLVGLKIWAKKCDFVVTEIPGRYVCTITVMLPDGIKFGKARGFSVNTRSSYKTAKSRILCENECLAMALKLIYPCTRKK